MRLPKASITERVGTVTHTFMSDVELRWYRSAIALEIIRLRAIDRGTYVRCNGCGAPIPIWVDEINPFHKMWCGLYPHNAWICSRCGGTHESCVCTTDEMLRLERDEGGA